MNTNVEPEAESTSLMHNVTFAMVKTLMDTLLHSNTAGIQRETGELT